MRTLDHQRSTNYARGRLILLLAMLSLLLLAAPALAQHHDDHGDAHAAEQHAAPGHDDPHHAMAADAHGDAHGDDHGGGFHLDNIYKLLVKNLVPVVMGGDADAKSVKAVTDGFLAWKEVFYTFVVIIILALFFSSVGRNLRDRDPTRKQLLVEMLVGGLYGIFQQILGKEARRFTPYLGTLFLFILLNNWSGMIPLGFSSTSSLANTTLGLGLMTFLYVQFTGIRMNGIGGYLYHLAGQPKSGLEWGFSVLIFPLEVLGELIKPISLSLRLFGNIYGEETLIAVMVIMGTQFMQFLLGLMGDAGVTAGQFLPGFPFQFPFYFLVLIASTVQALVFTLLSAVYISLMLPHDHEEAH